eukprot:gene4634-8207_t
MSQILPGAIACGACLSFIGFSTNLVIRLHDGEKRVKDIPSYFRYGLMMRDLAIGDVIHGGFHKKGSVYKEHEDAMDNLYLKLYKSKNEE